MINTRVFIIISAIHQEVQVWFLHWYYWISGIYHRIRWDSIKSKVNINIIRLPVADNSEGNIIIPWSYQLLLKVHQRIFRYHDIIDELGDTRIIYGYYEWYQAWSPWSLHMKIDNI
jgi:hypothetical protein